MSIVAVQTFIQSSLDNLAWPSAMTGVPNLAAYITPPDPNVQASVPVAYVWPGSGEESRSTPTGTMPRAKTAGGPSGFKGETHLVDIFMLFKVASNDPDANNLFPGMVDAVKAALRVVQSPYEATDPWTGNTSWIYNVGEIMRYQIAVRALEDQADNEYSALITCSVLEEYAA